MAKDIAEQGTKTSAEPISVDLCVIGGGAGGVAVATAAAALGRSVVLIEKHKLGGDSLHYGCVPSKVLATAAKRASEMRSAWAFGIAPAQPLVDLQVLNARIRDVVERVGLNSSAARLAGLGVRIIPAAASFVGKSLVKAGELRVTARQFVIATGASPEIPKIEGLDSLPYLTNESLFENIRPMPELLVLGGGPHALEMAQAFRRLGSAVTVISEARVLAGEDPELAAVVVNRLHQEGIVIREQARVVRASRFTDHVELEIDTQAGRETIRGSDVLIAGARRPNIADLGLATAGVVSDSKGISVDNKLRTRNGRVYAIGAATGSTSATAALEHARMIVRRLVLGLPVKLNQEALPRLVFTEPSLASVGLSEEKARVSHKGVRVLRWPYYENDLAQAEGNVDGHIKVVTDAKGRILGASLAGAGAAEQISLWSLALSQQLSVSDMVRWPVPYPTYSELSHRVALRYYATLRISSISRKIIALLGKLG